jgi:hypothetical protein
MFLFSSAPALAKGKIGGGSSSYFDGPVYGCDQTTLNTWVLPGATVTFTYWWANGILWNQVTERTTTDATGYFKYTLIKDGSAPIDWTAGVIVKAYKRSSTDPLSNYWTERSVLNRYWYQDMVLPRDRQTYVYDMLQYSNTNYVNIILPDGYQTKVGVTAYKALDYRGFPYASDLNWIANYGFTSAYHSSITGEFGKTIGSRIPFYCTGEYCPDSGYPVIDSAAIYGSQGTRQDVGVKPNYLLADPEYMPYDVTKLKTWAVNRNSARNPVGNGFDWAVTAPFLSGSINLPSGVGSMVNLNTYYYYGYHWYVGSASQPLATKLTMYKDTAYHINCIGSVPANDPQASRALGFRFDPTTNNFILHVWCTVGTEAMTLPFTKYDATVDLTHTTTQHYTSPWSSTGYSIYPISHVDTGLAYEGVGAISGAACPAWFDAWPGFSVPFTSRAATFSVQCDWTVSWSAYMDLVCWKDTDTGFPVGSATATVRLQLVVEVYDTTTGLLVGTTITSICDVSNTEGNGHQIADVSWSSSGTAISGQPSVMITGATAGHSFKVVTSMHAYVYALADTGNQADCALFVDPAKNQFGLLSEIIVSY